MREKCGTRIFHPVVAHGVLGPSDPQGTQENPNLRRLLLKDPLYNHGGNLYTHGRICEGGAGNDLFQLNLVAHEIQGPSDPQGTQANPNLQRQRSIGDLYNHGGNLYTHGPHMRDKCGMHFFKPISWSQPSGDPRRSQTATATSGEPSESP